jgi:hypothetical protein
MAELPDDELVKEVFAHFGLAAYLAQVLERSLVSALTTVYGPGSKRLTQSELDTRFEDSSERNLGALLRTLHGAGLSTEIMPTVRDALKDRNRLAHHFFWDHATEFMSVDGCHRMLRDLTEMQERFRDCSAKVEAEVQQWAAAHGITTADFEAVHGAMLERGRVLNDAELNELLEQRGGRRDPA